jgi:drug/metabolite transporter (DMT)-like permease
MKEISRETFGMLLGFIGTAIFAGTFPATRLALPALDPLFIAIGRAAVSGILSGAILITLVRRWPT